jgi:tripartite-type tricarboxylate transporter receptor subunit TctC
VKALLFACLCLFAHASWAQAYPSKPIRLVVPFPPGGSTDIFARPIAQKLSEAFRQQVVVENRGGAGGTIGADMVAKAAPDGYTLLMGHIGTLAVAPSLYPNLPYDPAKSFAPVSLVVTVANLLVVNPSLPVKTVGELVDHARRNPGKLHYGSGGNGSAAHIATELFKLRTATIIEHVPYRGTGPSVVDLLSGQIDLTMTGVPPVIEFVRNGRLRALGVSSAQRIDALPEVPTIAEAGVKDFEATQWYGIVAPAGTPPAIIARLNAELRTILSSPEMRSRIALLGAIADPSTPEQFAERIASERVRWREVVQAARIQPE